MGLYAYMLSQDNSIEKYLLENYGDIPRFRGVRFMKCERYCGEDELFDSYVGKDVVYIHTRCGDCGYGFCDPDSNYVSWGGEAWEKEHEDLFLNHKTDSFDRTYCDHYFRAVINDDYINIIKESEEE